MQHNTHKNFQSLQITAFINKTAVNFFIHISLWMCTWESRDITFRSKFSQLQDTWIFFFNLQDVAKLLLKVVVLIYNPTSNLRVLISPYSLSMHTIFRLLINLNGVKSLFLICISQVSCDLAVWIDISSLLLTLNQIFKGRGKFIFKLI